MTHKQLIKEIQDNLTQTTDISVLADWDMKLSSEYAWLATQLGEVKKDRARDEIEIRKRLLETEGKYTEAEIERQYFATEKGRFLAENEIVLKGISRLISAVRSQKEYLKI